jgi:hypothetical protein
MPVSGGGVTLGDRDWLPLALGAAIVLIASHGAHILFGASFQLPPYSHGILVPNYLEHGFVRRGLGGTVYALTEWFGGGRGGNARSFQLVCAIWAAVPLMLLVRRLSRTQGSRWLWLSLVLLAAPQLFWGWTRDIGRSDMLVAGFIAWSLLFALQGRYVLAVLPLVAGTLAHETATIYGFPLLVALGFLDYRAERSTPTRLLAAAVLMAVSLALVLTAQLALSAPPERLAAAILDGGSQQIGAAQAAYATIGGMRAITAFLCQSYGRPATPLFLLANVGVLALYVPVFLLWSRQGVLMVAFTALLPMATISLIGVDYGRWEMFAVFNAWLTAVALQIRGVEPAGVSRTSYVLAAVALLALIAMKPARVYVASGAVSGIARAIWGQSGYGFAPLEHCDPTWRSVVSPRSNRAALIPPARLVAAEGPIVR